MRYGDDGSRAVEMYLTSYTNQNGGEALVSRSIPDHPFETALGRTLDATLPAWARLILPLTVSAAGSGEDEEVQASYDRLHYRLSGRDVPDDQSLLFSPGAAGADGECLAGPVVGRETILNYPTTAVEEHLGEQEKMTFWTAPALGCFALRITSEMKGADGRLSPDDRQAGAEGDMEPVNTKRRPPCNGEAPRKTDDKSVVVRPGRNCRSRRWTSPGGC